LLSKNIKECRIFSYSPKNPIHACAGFFAAGDDLEQRIPLAEIVFEPDHTFMKSKSHIKTKLNYKKSSK